MVLIVHSRSGDPTDLPCVRWVLHGQGACQCFEDTGSLTRALANLSRTPVVRNTRSSQPPFGR